MLNLTKRLPMDHIVNAYSTRHCVPNRSTERQLSHTCSLGAIAVLHKSRSGVFPQKNALDRFFCWTIRITEGLRNAYGALLTKRPHSYIILRVNDARLSMRIDCVTSAICLIRPIPFP